MLACCIVDRKCMLTYYTEPVIKHIAVVFLNCEFQQLYKTETDETTHRSNLQMFLITCTDE